MLKVRGVCIGEIIGWKYGQSIKSSYKLKFKSLAKNSQGEAYVQANLQVGGGKDCVQQWTL